MRSTCREYAEDPLFSIAGLGEGGGSSLGEGLLILFIFFIFYLAIFLVPFMSSPTIGQRMWGYRGFSRQMPYIFGQKRGRGIHRYQYRHDRSYEGISNIRQGLFWRVRSGRYKIDGILKTTSMFYVFRHVFHSDPRYTIYRKSALSANDTTK